MPGAFLPEPPETPGEKLLERTTEEVHAKPRWLVSVIVMVAMLMGASALLGFIFGGSAPAAPTALGYATAAANRGCQAVIVTSLTEAARREEIARASQQVALSLKMGGWTDTTAEVIDLGGGKVMGFVHGERCR